MKKFVAMILTTIISMFVLTGCGSSTSSTLGNGKIDPVEKATLNVAIGAAMSAYPAAIEPAYIVSGALLVALGGDNAEMASITTVVDNVIAEQVNKLDMDKATKASFNDLVALIRIKVESILLTEKIESTNTYVVVKDLVKIINEAAAARR